MNNMKLCVLYSAIFLGACAQQATDNQQNTITATTINQTLNVVQAIPKPSDMTADVVTNARVSTIKNIDVAYVGQQIPFTFSDGKVSNTEGFEWYVSKHFALKTDYPSDKAKFFLELLELSYPYYVEYFGMEPPNIDQQRIASTYATNNDKLRSAMFDDGFNRGIHHTAGGEAMYYNWVGYSFPTERPQHQRYISIHETMHSYQMALGNYPWTPSWFSEGLGDSTANHVFDSKKKQLTVFGHDVPIFDMMSWGLSSYNKEQPTIVDIHNRKKFDRGLNVLFVQFMYNSPEYSQYIKIYHQEVMRRQTDSRADSLEILQSIVPNWDKLESEFKVWVNEIDETHVVASRGQWEMDGNMFYKRKSNYDYAPQRLGFTMTPAEQPQYREFSIDFPAPEVSNLLLSAKRGVDEPVLAYQLSYQKESIAQGQLGLALGVKSTEENTTAKVTDYRGWKGGNTDFDQQLRIEIKSASHLLIDGRNLSGQLHEYPLPADIITSLSNQKNPQLGVSIALKKNKIDITIKTIDAKAYLVTEEITAVQHENLLNRNFGLVSSDNQHGITPYMDDGRDLNPNNPDYNQPTAANAWGFKGDKLAQRFARANWKAGKSTPESWRDAFSRLNTAALNISTADAQIAAVNSIMPTLANDGALLNDALAELSGIELQLDWLGDKASNMKEYAIITNYSEDFISGKLSFEVNNETSSSIDINVKPGEKLNILIPTALLAKGKMVSAEFLYQWQGQNITQIIEQKTKKYNGYEIAHLTAAFNEGKLTINTELHGPFAGTTSGEITVDLYHQHTKITSTNKVVIQPYEEKLLTNSFNVIEKDLEHDAWFEVTIIAEVDGEPVILRKRLSFIPNKYNR